MRQRLIVREQFRRGNAAAHQNCRCTSKTEFNQTATEELSNGMPIGETFTAVLSPKKGDRPCGLYDKWRYGRNVIALADMLTSPDGLRTLEEAARWPASSRSAAALARALISGEAGSEEKR